MIDKLFLTNESEILFLDKIRHSLNKCKSFYFSVSFIKKAGLVLLIKEIENALKRGAIGKIITSTYQNFTDIGSLELFLSWQKLYPNFQCKLDYKCFNEQGFHTKGYIFEYDKEYEVIIGSSNITRFALLFNKEWDLAVYSNHNDNFLNDVLVQFNKYWDNTYELNNNLIKKYALQLEYAISSWDMDFDDVEPSLIKPNIMQKRALKEILKCRNLDNNRCLVIAATGSGKTYLAAFDALNFDAKKLLFVVHRDTVLLEALKTFKKIFSNKRTYGLFNGNNKDLEADFIFASNQMISRHLELFNKDEFDYIVIDEVHHAVVSSYKKIIDYFKPQFLLGLTATPERMDEKSVYDIFKNNVPYDLRLKDAINNDLVVPFHYYGIKDNLVSYEDDLTKEGIRKYIIQLSDEKNCSFIHEQIQKHLPKGKIKCVGFCKNVEHARLMSEGMKEFGYETAYLSARNPTLYRIKKFEDLQDDNKPLNIIFAVDILNEGVDVPAINLVLFLRPTESSTIFLQQLGRGLRKYKDKEYLIVLDFIGNSYLRSVQIIKALGTLMETPLPLDKPTIADLIKDRNSFTQIINIPGVIIDLDEESREEILSSAAKTNFNEIKFLKQDYQNFKAFLIKNNVIDYDQYPMPTDYLDLSDGVDIIKYIRKYNSYYDFLNKVENDCPYFNEESINQIRTLSWFLPLIRKEEYLILKALIDSPLNKLELFKKTGVKDELSFNCALDMLTKNVVGTFPTYFVPLIKYEDDLFSLIANLELPTFKSWYLNLIEYGLNKYDIDNYKKEGLLNLYGPYSGPKAFMALNSYKKNENVVNLMYMSGVHYINNELCLFINLNKDMQKEARLKYQDYFINKNILHWESQTNTTLTNSKGKALLTAKEAHLFVRKISKEDGIEQPFIYIGKGKLTNPTDSNKNPKTLLFDIILEHNIPSEFETDFIKENK